MDTRCVIKKVVIYDTDHGIQIDDVNGYVTVMYEDNWWLGYVLEKDFNSGEVKIKFLHPHGPSSLFTFPPPLRGYIVGRDVPDTKKAG